MKDSMSTINKVEILSAICDCFGYLIQHYPHILARAKDELSNSSIDDIPLMAILESPMVGAPYSVRAVKALMGFNVTMES